MNVSAFLQTLPMMLYGMCGIFVVILLIFLLVLALNKIFS